MSELAIEIQEYAVPDSPPAAVLLLRGSLDASTLHVLEDQLKGVTARAIRRIVLDMAKLKYVSSGGFGAIISLCNALQPGGSVCVVQASPRLKEFFDWVGITDLVNYCESIPEALRLLGVDPQRPA